MRVICYNWKNYLNAKNAFGDDLRKKFTDNFKESLDIVYRQAKILKIPYKSMNLVDKLNLKIKFITRYYSVRRIVFSQDLDEYRLCKKLYPSSNYTLKDIDFDFLRQELKTNSKEYLWKGSFRYMKSDEVKMIEEMKLELKLGNNLKNYDVGEGSTLYSMLGVKRPRLYLPINEENLRFHQQSMILAFLKEEGEIAKKKFLKKSNLLHINST